MNTPNKDLVADAANYVKELNTDSVVSYSHYTLRSGCERWGKEAFDAEVDRQLNPAKDQTP